jgi:hypothetical protein
MKLIYVPRAGFVGPAAPWPGQDHDEPDEGIAKDKLASGFYRSESGKEQKECQAETKTAKKVANTKAADDAAEEAADADAVAVEATETAKTLKTQADAAKRTAR